MANAVLVGLEAHERFCASQAVPRINRDCSLAAGLLWAERPMSLWKRLDAIEILAADVASYVKTASRRGAKAPEYRPAERDLAATVRVLVRLAQPFVGDEDAEDGDAV